MPICKKIDPVIDIVVIGFGIKSMEFIDFFLKKNLLKGVNIIVICKNYFRFLNETVQDAEMCRETYIDIYLYCKQNNILFINDKVKRIDTEDHLIHFYFGRNPLNYDFLLFDFDYTSSKFIKCNESKIYAFRKRESFFYYSHIIYLSLIEASRNEKKKTDIQEYYQWKLFYMDQIKIKKFKNFPSLNDSYVDTIFELYELLEKENLSEKLKEKEKEKEKWKENSILLKEVHKMNVEKVLKKTNSFITESERDINNSCLSQIVQNEIKNKKKIPTHVAIKDRYRKFTFLLLSNNHDLGKRLYLEILENLKKITNSFNFIYVTYANSANVDFCENYVIIKNMIELNTDNIFEKYIKFKNEKETDVTLQFDECFNVTGLKYPYFFYLSNFRLQLEQFVFQFKKNEYKGTLYFLNQIEQEDNFLISERVYLDIYNKINKKNYASIEVINGDIEIKRTFTCFSNRCTNFNEMLTTRCSIGKKVICILRRWMRYAITFIKNNKFVKKQIKMLNKYNTMAQEYLSDEKKKNDKQMCIRLFITFIVYIYNQFIVFLSFIIKEIIREDYFVIETQNIKNEGGVGIRDGCGIDKENECGIDKENECETDKENECETDKENECETDKEMPPYIYDCYQREYEKRLLVNKKTSFKINNKIDEWDNTNIIIEKNSIEKNNIKSSIYIKNVHLYIKKSINKIMNRTTCGGCGSKVPSNVLSKSLMQLDIFNSDNVYLGIEGSDDCCIFVPSKNKIEEGNSSALVQTIDFFKSFIDDEYVLGEIIAIHCLSDIYSMGGKGICALCVLIIKDNIERKLQQRLQNILTGCCLKLKEECCVLSGGHTCAGTENYVGLAVTGEIEKRKKGKTIYNEATNEETNEANRNGDLNRLQEKNMKIMLNKEFAAIKKYEWLIENYKFLPKGNKNINSGDVIITTKMFGFGFIMAAHIEKTARGRWVYNCLDEMLMSNKQSGLLFLENNAKVCTDVTGFGILGHLNEVIKCSRKAVYLYNKFCDSRDFYEPKGNTDYNKEMEKDENVTKPMDQHFIMKENKKVYKNALGAKLFLNKIPIAEGADECIEMNIFSSMFKKNHFLCNSIINLEKALNNKKYGILFDPQTSGGLLAVVTKENAESILYKLKQLGYVHSTIIGEIINVQNKEMENVPINQIPLGNYLDTTNSVYIEC